MKFGFFNVVNALQLTVMTNEPVNYFKGAAHETDAKIEDKKAVVKLSNLTIPFDDYAQVESFISTMVNFDLIDDLTLKEVEKLDKVSPFTYTKLDKTKSGMIDVIVLFTDNPDTIKTISRIPFLKKSLLYLSTDRNLALRNGCQFPGAMIYSSKDSRVKKMAIPENIGELVTYSLFGSIDEVNPEDVYFIRQILPRMMYLIVNDNADVEELRNIYLAKGNNVLPDDALVLVTRQYQVNNILEYIKPQDSDYPILFGIQNTRKYCARNTNPDNLAEKYQSIVTGNAERIIVNDTIPADNSSLDLKTTNYDLFYRDILNNSSNHRVLFLRNSNSKNDAELEIYAKHLGQMVKNFQLNLQVYQFNVLANDIPEELPKSFTGQFSELYLYNAGGNSQPIQVKMKDSFTDFIGQFDIFKSSAVDSAKLSDMIKEVENSIKGERSVLAMQNLQKLLSGMNPNKPETVESMSKENNDNQETSKEENVKEDIL